MVFVASAVLGCSVCNAAIPGHESTGICIVYFTFPSKPFSFLHFKNFLSSAGRAVGPRTAGRHACHGRGGISGAFIRVRDGLFDNTGEIGPASREFLQTGMDRYAAWVKEHTGGS